MADIPVAIGAYERQQSRLPEQRLVNSFFETTPTPEVPGTILARPGLVSQEVLGAGPVRGVFQAAGVLNGDTLVVSGPTLYRAGVAIGAVTGSGPVTFASDDAQVLIATGSTLYRVTASGSAGVSFPDSAAVTDVAYLAGYFLAARADTGKVYFSAVGDGSSWDGLDFFTAESRPDNVVAMQVVGDELWLLGDNSGEPWGATGDADLPFQRLTGRVTTRGCRARHTVRLFDNSVVWVGDDGKVYRASSVPDRISTHGIEERIKNSVADDLRAFVFPWAGHEFYVLRTTQGTFAYDAATQQWAEFASYGRTTWRAHVGTTVGGDVVCGDEVNGTLWRLTDDVALDGDDPIIREASAIIPAKQSFTVFNVIVDAATGATPDLAGQGADPVIELRWSNDYGRTWSDWEPQDLGAQGEYRVTPVWTGLGLADRPGMPLEFRLSDPVPWRISRVAVNEDIRGLAR